MKAARLLNVFALSAILVAFYLQAWFALPKLSSTTDEPFTSLRDTVTGRRMTSG